MKNLLITIATVLTLFSCNPKEETVTPIKTEDASLHLNYSITSRSEVKDTVNYIERSEFYVLTNFNSNDDVELHCTVIFMEGANNIVEEVSIESGEKLLVKDGIDYYQLVYRLDTDESFRIKKTYIKAIPVLEKNIK